MAFGIFDQILDAKSQLLDTFAPLLPSTIDLLDNALTKCKAITSCCIKEEDRESRRTVLGQRIRNHSSTNCICRLFVIRQLAGIVLDPKSLIALGQNQN